MLNYIKKKNETIPNICEIEGAVKENNGIANSKEKEINHNDDFLNVKNLIKISKEKYVIFLL